VWAISPDARWLIISRYATESQADLLKVDLQAAPGPGAVTALVATPSEEGAAAISPDGEWFAYTASRGHEYEVLVEKFPGGGQKTRVFPSVDGAPIWSRDGREIYFRAAGRGADESIVMAARISTTPAFQVSEPRQLFTGRFFRGRDMGRAMILAPDDRRFLMIRTPPGTAVSGGTGYATQLLVVQNWFEELKAKVLK
jgi:Tol biopolymer transport system component